jgi:hypothetical protein
MMNQGSYNQGMKSGGMGGVMSTSMANKDPATVVYSIMKEMNKTNRMINKDDILACLGNKIDKKSFESALNKLVDDGTIYIAYGDDVFALNE